MSFTGNYSGGRTFSNSTSSSLQQLQLSYANSNYLLYVDGTTTVQSSKVSETTIEQLNSGVFNSFSAFSFQPKSLLSNSYIFEILNYSGTNLFKIDTSNNVYFGGFSNNAGYLYIDSTGKLSLSSGTSSISSSYTLGNTFTSTSNYYNYLPIYNTQTSTLNYSATLSPYLDNAGNMYIQYNGGNNLQLNQYNIQFNESSTSTTYADKYIDFSDKDNLDYVYRIIKPAYTNPNIIHQYNGTGSFCIQNLNSATNNIVQFYNNTYSLGYTSNTNNSNYVAAITGNGIFKGYGLTLSGLSSATLTSSSSTNYLMAVNSVSNSVGYSSTLSPYFDLSGNFTSKGSITGTSISTTGTFSSGSLTATSGTFTSGLTVSGYNISLSTGYNNYFPTFNPNDNKFTIASTSPYIDLSGILTYNGEIKANSFYTTGTINSNIISNTSTITSAGNITSNTGNIIATAGSISATSASISGSLTLSGLTSTLSTSLKNYCTVINSGNLLINSTTAPYIDGSGNFTSKGTITGTTIYGIISATSGSFSGGVYFSGLSSTLTSKNYIPGISTNTTSNLIKNTTYAPYYDGSGNFTSVGTISGTTITGSSVVSTGNISASSGSITGLTGIFTGGMTLSGLNSTLSSTNYLALFNGSNLLTENTIYGPTVNNFGNLTINNSGSTTVTSTLSNTNLTFSATDSSNVDKYIQFEDNGLTSTNGSYLYRIWATPASSSTKTDIYHTYYGTGDYYIWSAGKTTGDIVKFSIEGVATICAITTAGEFTGRGITATALSYYSLSSTLNYLPAVNSGGEFVTSTSNSPYISSTGNLTVQGSVSGTSLSTTGTLSSGSHTATGTVTAPSYALSGSVTAGFLYSNSSGVISTSTSISLPYLYYTQIAALPASKIYTTYTTYALSFAVSSSNQGYSSSVLAVYAVVPMATASTSAITVTQYSNNSYADIYIANNQIYFVNAGTYKLTIRMTLYSTISIQMNLALYLNQTPKGQNVPILVNAYQIAATTPTNYTIDYIFAPTTTNNYIALGIFIDTATQYTFYQPSLAIDVIQLA